MSGSISSSVDDDCRFLSEYSGADLISRLAAAEAFCGELVSSSDRSDDN